ncbi:hypothetical protein KCP74_23395 [Salmonella enterica subsp. enterica]|nr:hypothetical protein KCP74_23395 [Salmonella enterica subsp. enterica]
MLGAECADVTLLPACHDGAGYSAATAAAQNRRKGVVLKILLSDGRLQSSYVCSVAAF